MRLAKAAQVDFDRSHRARETAGLPTLRVHDCRHVWAVTMIAAGTPLNELMAIGGWSCLETVQRYTRHAPRNAAERAREG